MNIFMCRFDGEHHVSGVFTLQTFICMHVIVHVHVCVWALVWAAGAVSNSYSWGGCYFTVYRTLQSFIPCPTYYHRDRGRDGKRGKRTTELICHYRPYNNHLTHTVVHTNIASKVCVRVCVCVLSLCFTSTHQHKHSCNTHHLHATRSQRLT